MPFNCVAECSEAMLGQLPPSPLIDDGVPWLDARPPSDPAKEEAVVSGVRLPQDVILELRKLGLPLFAYTQGELREILAACAADARLVDDPEGVDLKDKMTLTAQEIREDRGETDLDPRRGKPPPYDPKRRFCHEVRLERHRPDSAEEREPDSVFSE